MSTSLLVDDLCPDTTPEGAADAPDTMRSGPFSLGATGGPDTAIIDDGWPATPGELRARATALAAELVEVERRIATDSQRSAALRAALLDVLPDAGERRLDVSGGVVVLMPARLRPAADGTFTTGGDSIRVHLAGDGPGSSGPRSRKRCRGDRVSR